MTAVTDVIGHRFGRAFVVCRYGSIYNGQATWWCYCDCGIEFIATAKALIAMGDRASCGCLCRARKAAKEAGLIRYFTGRPCPKGHIAERFVSKGSCVICTEESQQKRRAENPELIQAQQREWRTNNLEHCRALGRSQRLRNIDKVRASLAAWRAENNAEYLRNRRKNDVQFRLASNLRSRLKMAIREKYKSGSAVRDLGCTIPELIGYLEILFEPGMSWENYGEWHIDHRRPLATFDLTDREQLLAACHWTNLQPLWALDNMRKGARYAA